MSRLPGLDSWRGVLALSLLLLACQQGMGAAAIQAKAWLAPILIERAWQRSIAIGGAPVKPWPWADTWPVARLSAPSKGIDLMVLDGDSGNALAFGPGLASYSSPSVETGLTVIAGHRDTHFSFLQELRVGDHILLQTDPRAAHVYAIEDVRVVDAERETIRVDDDAASLLLVTCYPFDALLPGGALRYAVRARRWSL